ncbi:MAG: hypothetical protein JSS66_18950 [Armatimonadetes bacterium]|nr:hypothetical protein [Armatimonadota bacterium]
MASCAIFDPRPTPYFDENGCLAVGAKAYFFAAQTNNPLTVYVDPDLTTPHAFPVVALSNGTFPPIYLPFTDYRVVIRSAQDVALYDAAVVNNPAPSSGSGGGTSPTSDQLLQTGDPIWRLRAGSMIGFVRMNGRTLGSAASGATEYAAGDAENLFGYLWNNLNDAIAPVSSGRGVSSTADWQANKTIVIPTMRGYTAAGIDDMGNTAAQSIQIITTASVINSSPTVTVASSLGLARGMSVVINGAAAGKIIDIPSSTTVTLDTNYAGSTASNLSFRASMFSDAQLVGAVGGSQSITQTAAEMPQHNHTLTDPGHTHSLNFQGGLANGVGGSATNGGTPAVGVTGSATTGVTLADAGKGLPTPIIQPGRLGTWFMKL